jgi:hypothetical protein
MKNSAADRFSSFTTFNPKWICRQFTINLASDEAKMLEKYCDLTGKAPTDVIRELIRELPNT